MAVDQEAVGLQQPPLAHVLVGIPPEAPAGRRAAPAQGCIPYRPLSSSRLPATAGASRRRLVADEVGLTEWCSSKNAAVDDQVVITLRLQRFEHRWSAAASACWRMVCAVLAALMSLHPSCTRPRQESGGFQARAGLPAGSGRPAACVAGNVQRGLHARFGRRVYRSGIGMTNFSGVALGAGAIHSASMITTRAMPTHGLGPARRCPLSFARHACSMPNGRSGTAISPGSSGSALTACPRSNPTPRRCTRGSVRRCSSTR